MSVRRLVIVRNVSSLALIRDSPVIIGVNVGIVFCLLSSWVVNTFLLFEKMLKSGTRPSCCFLGSCFRKLLTVLELLQDLLSFFSVVRQVDLLLIIINRHLLTELNVKRGRGKSLPCQRPCWLIGSVLRENAMMCFVICTSNLNYSIVRVVILGWRLFITGSKSFRQSVQDNTS